MGLLLCLSTAAYAEGPDVVGGKISDFSFKVTSVTYLDDRTTLNT